MALYSFSSQGIAAINQSFNQSIDHSINVCMYVCIKDDVLNSHVSNVQTLGSASLARSGVMKYLTPSAAPGSMAPRTSNMDMIT